MKKRPEDRRTYISFSDAIEIARVPPKQIRHWFDRYEGLELDANARDASKHRRFSQLDIVRIALWSNLATHQFSATEASRLTEFIFAEALAMGGRTPGDKDALIDKHERQMRNLFPTMMPLICVISSYQEVLPFLRGLSITIFFHEDDTLASNEQTADYSWFLHPQEKDPFEPRWSAFRSGEQALFTSKDSPLNRAVIRIGEMVDRINHRLEEAGLI